MKRRRRALRLFLLAVALGAGWFVFVAWSDRVDPVEAIPAGAAGAADVRDLEGTYARMAGTRFAAAFAGGALGAWVEGTEAVRALDALRDGLRAATHLPIERRHLLDVVGRRTAVAWYGEPAAPGFNVPWLAACRLSTRAWAIARALLLAQRLGLAEVGMTRETLAGRVAVAFPGGTADHAWHAFLVGRLLVIGNDRALLVRAVRCLDGREADLRADPSWSRIRSGLPEGDTFVWAAGGLAGLPGADGRTGPAGAVLRTGARTEVHLFAGREGRGRDAAPAADEIPGAALLAAKPLVLHASRGVPPAPLLDLLDERRRRVAARAGTAPRPGAAPAPGFLVAITGADDGPLPRPRGALLITMPGAAAAAAEVAALFPQGARTETVAGVSARRTRDSLPLAGEFEVWGAALGPQVVIATGAAEIAAVANAVRGAGAAPWPRTGWRIDTVTSVSGTELFPILRRYAPFAAGVVAARVPGTPNLARDIDLLAVLRAATILTGGDDDGRRALVELDLQDLPERP